MDVENREAWAKVARIVAPGYPSVAQAVRSGAGEPFDDLRWALHDRGQTAYIDWKSDPDEIRRELKSIQKFPHRFRWSWFPAFIETLQDCDTGEDTTATLEEIGERCLQIKYALLSMELNADGYLLFAVHTDRLPYILDLTAEAGRKFRVIRRGCWKS
ncbi:DUF6630 family protein [Nocardia sp. NPDC004722]